MGSNGRPGQSLSPSQQNLLYTALASNQRSSSQSKINGTNGNHSQSPLSADPSVFTSPNQDMSGQLDDSPLFDQLEENNFDFDNNEQLFGDIDDYDNDYDENGDLHDKRKASSTSDDGDHKRQEGETKTPKKPGRKPITEQPTTKRKAQNRAAQRAFRERKEKHLKDLEVKVDDLEKASEATNHENGRLRAQVDKLATEVKEYRKRLSMTNAAQNYSPPAAQSRNPYENNDFSYAFPKFGDLPKSFMENGSLATSSTSLPQVKRSSSSSVRQTSIGTTSPTNTNGNSNPFALPQTTSPQSFSPYKDTSITDLTGLFSPSILQSVSRSNSADFGFPSGSSTGGTSVKNGGSFSNANNQPPKPHRASSASTMNSPASSLPFDSSVGTTPEPSGDNAASPDSTTKTSADPASILRTINEEGAPNTNQSPFPTSSDSFSGIDWMAAQNGGAFDPVLFGEYRDSQNNVLEGLDSLNDDFFTDAMGVRGADFSSPYNTGDLMPSEPKRDLMREIETTEAQGLEPMAQMNDPNITWMAPSQVWDRAQSTPGWDDKSKEEIDGLCSQFKDKAQCSGKGAVVAEKDVDEILRSKQQQQQQQQQQGAENKQTKESADEALKNVGQQGDHTTEGCEKAVRDAGVGGMFGSFL